MTELHHFHPARKGSGSLRPFPIYPLYTQTVILSLDKPIADCFLFRPRKSRERRRKCSHTNVSNASVIRFSTPPAQTATFAFTSESGYTLGFRRKIAHSGSYAETGGVSDGGGITTLGALCVLPKRWTPACQNDSFAVFLVWLLLR